MGTPYVYYRVESGPVFDFLQTHRENRKLAGKRLMEWAEAHGAIGFVPGFGSRVIGGWAINSLIFEGKPEDPVWRLGRHPTTDGKDQWKPRQNTKAGRALAKEMQSLEGMPCDDKFCATFGFPHGISYSGNGCIRGGSTLASCSLTTARIGWTSDTCYWVVLPDYAAIRAKYEADGYEIETPPWTVPEGMIPLTKAHYELAQAQAEVDRLEAKVN
jgi:hypothetical protein